MSEALTMVLFLIAFLTFIEFRKRRSKKFNDSPLFIIIEKQYKNWHRMNGTILNKKYTTVFEIDRILFELRSKLLDYGLSLIHIYLSIRCPKVKARKKKWPTLGRMAS